MNSQNSGKPSGHKLSSLLEKLNSKRSTLDSSNENTLSVFPFVLKSGSPTIFVAEKTEHAASMAVHVVSGLLQKSDIKVLHIVPDIYLQSTTLKYLSSLSSVATRNINNPNFDLKKIQDVIGEKLERITLSPLHTFFRSHRELWEEMSSVLADHKYDLLVIEAPSKFFGNVKSRYIQDLVDDLFVEATFETGKGGKYAVFTESHQHADLDDRLRKVKLTSVDSQTFVVTIGDKDYDCKFDQEKNHFEFSKEARLNKGLDSVLGHVKSGASKGQFVFGKDEKTGKTITKSPVVEPGAIFVGGMGSGKTVAMKYTALMDRAINGELAKHYYVDLLKGATDFAPLQTEDEAATVITEKEEFLEVLNLVYEEAQARMEAFKQVGAKDINEYCTKTKIKLARITFFIEEAHAVFGQSGIDFWNKEDRVGTAAHSMVQLLRIGRALGISFMIASQRASTSDIPSLVIATLATKMFFGSASRTDCSILGFEHAENRKDLGRGLCAWDDGFMQFPILTDEEIKEVLLMASKFKGKLLKKK